MWEILTYAISIKLKIMTELDARKSLHLIKTNLYVQSKQCHICKI